MNTYASTYIQMSPLNKLEGKLQKKKKDKDLKMEYKMWFHVAVECSPWPRRLPVYSSSSATSTIFRRSTKRGSTKSRGRGSTRRYLSLKKKKAVYLQNPFTKYDVSYSWTGRWPYLADRPRRSPSTFWTYPKNCQKRISGTLFTSTGP